VWVRTEQVDTPFTQRAASGQVLKLPIAHGEGNYFAEPAVISALEASGRVVFRYCDAAGRVTDEANPNGSVNGIAGICNEARNVVGLMPHPERACEMVLGSSDGRVMFESVIDALAGQGVLRSA
jgi:phosphoribosylformylglycinamidine synthase